MKTIEVVPYNPKWPMMFEVEAALIKDILGDHCISVHHIGSTSVPGLTGKQNLDIVCSVDQLPSCLSLQNLDYVFKGEMGIPFRYYFSKNTLFSKVNLHVVEPDNGFIALNLCFRDYLRNHEDARLTYIRLKEELLKNPKSYQKANSQYTGYNLGKDQFIKSILAIAGFDELVINFCIHYKEWDTVKIFRKKYFCDAVSIADPYFWKFNHPDHVHLVLYKGVKIIGYAHLQFKKESKASLHILVIDEPYQGQSFGGQLFTFLKRWLKSKGYKSLHVEPPINEFLLSKSF